jgi:hypothetical protein
VDDTPTAAVTDLYLEMKQRSQVPMLHTSARVDQDREIMVPWLHTMCSSLVWSARALNLIDAERAASNDRKRLRHAAKKLGISEFLAVKPDAKFRCRIPIGTRSETSSSRRCARIADVGGASPGASRLSWGYDSLSATYQWYLLVFRA